jgi:hypothetical protein
MKNRVAIFMFMAAIVFSGELYAQDSGQTFFKSVVVTYSVSVDKTGANNQSMGFAINLFIFPNDDTGYYISPGADLRMKHGASEIDKMDIYLGAVFGPAFRIHDGDDVDILAGVGADFSCIVRLGRPDGGDFDSTETFLGLGVGSSLEARLKLYNSIAFTGGLLAKYNFAPYPEDKTFIARPYIGVGF